MTIRVVRSHWQLKRHEMGWPTGFEPATTRSTIWGSNQAELRPPANAREASFLCPNRQAPSRAERSRRITVSCRRWAKHQAPNLELQRSSKSQTPKTRPEPTAGRSVFRLGAWSLVLFWSLAFGISSWVPGSSAFQAFSSRRATFCCHLCALPSAFSR